MTIIDSFYHKHYWKIEKRVILLKTLLLHTAQNMIINNDNCKINLYRSLSSSLATKFHTSNNLCSIWKHLANREAQGCFLRCLLRLILEMAFGKDLFQFYRWPSFAFTPFPSPSIVIHIFTAGQTISLL